MDRNAEAGNSLEECYPLDAETDKNSLQLLKEKIKSLQEIISPNIEDINFNVVFEKINFSK